MEIDLKKNANRFSGKKYLEIYQKYRPTPPSDILLLALQFANTSNPDTVIDLGCGTGISTRIWPEYANKIIGVEPSEEMVTLARELTKDDKITFVQQFSNDTGLSSEMAEVVTCSQSLHWMEPAGTLAEINRLLKPSGVFLVYDVVWPPIVHPDLEIAYQKLFTKIDHLTSSLPGSIAHKWSKTQHYLNIKNSDLFSFVKKCHFHKSVTYHQDQFIGIALSQGGLEALLKRGFSSNEIGIDEFREKVMSVPTLPGQMMTYQYDVIIAVK